jgi:hypothetical protein
MSAIGENIRNQSGGFSPADIMEEPVSLMHRESDRLAIDLWLVRSTAMQYVTVVDYKGVGEDESPTYQYIEVPENHRPLDKKTGLFWHALAI